MVKPRPLQKDPALLSSPLRSVSLASQNSAPACWKNWACSSTVSQRPSRHGYLAGDDSARAKDLMEAFLDPAIDGIFCIRGGYGASRILPLLDFDRIRSCPKFFGGFSDITALHICLNQFCQLMTYHIPMPSTIVHKGLDPYTRRQILNCMAGFEEDAIENPPDIPFLPLVSGQAEGN
ncbi:MAG: LD-carboxypeptidase [Clostridia bacterium]